MPQPTIEPKSVTKPIQLLAAWLAGLVLIDGAFLAGATQITTPSWAAGALTVAAIANVPIFLAFLFLMQTRFRPEMLEDTFYSVYLERKSAETRKVEFIRLPAKEINAPVRRNFPGYLEAKSTRSIEWKSKAHVNDLLPNFDKIVATLREENIMVGSTFGSTSSQQKAPSPFIVSMGIDADVPTFQRIIAKLDQFGIEGVAVTSEGFDEDDIHIGSYIFENYGSQIKPYSTDLRDAILQPGLSRHDLISLLGVIHLE